MSNSSVTNRKVPVTNPKVQDTTMTNPRAKVDDFFVILALGPDISYTELHQFFQQGMYDCGSSDDERTPAQVCARRRLAANAAANKPSKKT